jgi:hypothetical protein
MPKLGTKLALATATVCLIVGIVIGFVILPNFVRLPTASDLDHTPTVAQTSQAAQQGSLSQPWSTTFNSTQSLASQTGTYTGQFYSKEVSRICSGAHCPRMDRQVFYMVTDSGSTYHLFFSCEGGMPTIVNATHVRVTGRLVTPSVWNATEWYPSISFDGDVLIQTIQAT